MGSYRKSHPNTERNVKFHQNILKIAICWLNATIDMHTDVPLNVAYIRTDLNKYKPCTRNGVEYYHPHYSTIRLLVTSLIRKNSPLSHRCNTPKDLEEIFNSNLQLRTKDWF